VAGFIQFDAEPEQYLFCYVLRAGNAPAKLGATGILARVFERLRQAFPKARLFVRLDGGFAGPEILDFLETQHVDYAVAMAGNAVLDRPSKRNCTKTSAANEPTSSCVSKNCITGWRSTVPAARDSGLTSSACR
jgi:hypothetical protein